MSRIDTRNRPRRGSHTTVTRTASLITFIKVRERQLRGGISARRKDRGSIVSSLPTIRVLLRTGEARRRTKCGNERGGREKAGWKWREEEGKDSIQVEFSTMIGKCYRSFHHSFPLSRCKIHRSSSSSSSSCFSLFAYYIERKGWNDSMREEEKQDGRRENARLIPG